ncbi:phosphoesterase [Thermococcus sp. EP1]|uniref:metallophosphoesterase family protein n=1 Tax=Thermococcus sp. EP1 TaxID=1591054 RepID=UPI0006DA6435|nr:metallophosphoesterase [Thermococcus sp. EP1]KPU63671.1 phosphoesterase [Thermococcus sp. EP1]
MRRIVAFLLVLLTLSLINVNQVSAEALPGDVLKYPMPGAPVVALPGEVVEIQPQDGVDITSLSIVSVLNGPYELEIIEKGATLKVKVPENVVPDVYFLQIKSNKGEVTIPGAVWILKEYPKVLRIAHVSDTHVTSGTKFGYVCGEYFQRDMKRIKELCDGGIIVPLHSYVATDSAYTYWAMDDRVDVTINTGDVVDTAGDGKGYKLLLDIISHATAAGRPTIIVKGNHDDPPNYYPRLIGPTDYYIVIGKFIIIALDSHGDEAHPYMNQLEWMEKVLEDHPDKIPIVIVHHPYWYSAPQGWIGGRIEGVSAFDDEDWQEMIQYGSYYWFGRNQEYLDIARRFLQDVEKYNIKLIMSGHIHHDKLHIYVDKNGNEHWFVTSTTTGAPDKETNPPRPDRSPTWYGSKIIEIDENGNVRLPEIEEMFGNLFNDFISLPVPQEFITFKWTSEFGSAVKFVNLLGEESGKFAIEIPDGAQVDTSVTNVTYKLLGERKIGDKTYELFEITVPKGISQLVISKGKDTEKPQIDIPYLTPSKPTKGKPFKVYISVKDNLGVKDIYVEIEANGVVTKYPAVQTSGGQAEYFMAEIPGIDADGYIIRAVAIDFYGNKATIEKIMGEIETSTTSTPTQTTPSETTTSSSTTPTTSSPTETTSSSSPTTTEAGGVCGPAAIVGLALLPLLAAKRKK